MQVKKAFSRSPNTPIEELLNQVVHAYNFSSCPRSTNMRPIALRYTDDKKAQDEVWRRTLARWIEESYDFEENTDLLLLANDYAERVIG